MAGPWSLDKLAAVSSETEARLRRYVDMGLLHRQPDEEFEPDSLHRLRLIQFARTRGVSDDQLAAVTASQGDVLGIFDEAHASADASTDLATAAAGLGLDDDVIAELVRRSRSIRQLTSPHRRSCRVAARDLFPRER